MLETFLKFGNLYPELAIHERTIDNLIELLKKDQLDETVQLEPLEKSLIYFQSLFNIHIADGRSQNHTQFLSNFVLLMKIGCEVAQFDSIIFQNLLSQNHVELDHIVTYLNDIQEFCKRIKRRITGQFTNYQFINYQLSVYQLPIISLSIINYQFINIA